MFRESSIIDSERTANSVRSLYAKYSADENWFTGTPDSVDRRIAQAKKIANAAKAACVRLSGRNVVSQYIALAHEMDTDRVALEGLRRDLLTASSDRDEELHFAKLDTTGWSGAEALKYIRENPDQRHNGDQAYACRCPNCTGSREGNKHVEYQEGFGHTIEKTRDPGDYEGKHRESSFVDLDSFDPITLSGRPEGAPRHEVDTLHHPAGRDLVHADEILRSNGVKPPGYFSRGDGKHRVEARHFIAEQECDDLRELTIRAKHFAERISSALPASQSAKFVRSFVAAVADEYEPPRQKRTAASNYNTQDFPADFLYLE